MARSLGRLLKGFQSLTSLPARTSQLSCSSSRASLRTMTTLPSHVSSKPLDFGLPNVSWGSEMVQLYEHYNSQCEVETEGGEKRRGPWQRLAIYNLSTEYVKEQLSQASVCMMLGRLQAKQPDGEAAPKDGSKIKQSKSRFFPRNIDTPGAGFEYAVFVNKEEERCVCIFQPGHLLEGPPGYVHGGATATLIDTVTGMHASQLSGPAVTANLNINYRSPIPLGSTVLIESSVEMKEDRKIGISCKVTSKNGSKLHTDAKVLFLSMDPSQLLVGGWHKGNNVAANQALSAN